MKAAKQRSEWGVVIGRGIVMFILLVAMGWGGLLWHYTRPHSLLPGQSASWKISALTATLATGWGLGDTVMIWPPGHRLPVRVDKWLPGQYGSMPVAHQERLAMEWVMMKKVPWAAGAVVFIIFAGFYTYRRFGVRHER
ncbi:hypothetical protein NB640_04265 [Oxalobacter vibrioformis]|uniref:Uncharacterized protein n=1 Tax=Oxalobacter vibrioformis TaxID=933080 RepID=A0A9E9M0E2_9BURK|nr:hypothetical protein [Oxalobacter vibrioformis]WAW10867.1 hypothetical protein NB640_04265 [Oxalobacter vibrioformis]